jgi:hypothetical protein
MDDVIETVPRHRAQCATHANEQPDHRVILRDFFD